MGMFGAPLGDDDPDLAARTAEVAGQLADQLETRERRDRLGELSTSLRFAAALDGAALAAVVEDGAFVDLFHDSPVPGSANPLSMGLEIRRDGVFVNSTALFIAVDLAALAGARTTATVTTPEDDR